MREAEEQVIADKMINEGTISTQGTASLALTMFRVQDMEEECSFPLRPYPQVNSRLRLR
jgi:hypothetical protein